MPSNTKPFPISVCVPISPKRWGIFVEVCLPSIVANRPAEIIIEDGTGKSPIVVAHDKCDASDARMTALMRKLEWTQKNADRIYEDERPTINANVKRNRAASVATQPFLFFCDDDAILTPECLSYMLGALQKHPKASYAYCDYVYVNHPRRKTGIHKAQPFDPAKLRWRNFVSTMSLLRAAHFPGFDESLARFQDWDLWLTMLMHDHVGVYVDTAYPLFTALYGDDCTSEDEGFNVALARIQEKHKLPKVEPQKQRGKPLCDKPQRGAGVDVVLLSYGLGAMTAECVRTITRSTIRDDLRLIWVDNGGPSDEFSIVQDAINESGLRGIWLQQETNVGFPRGMNAGLREFLDGEADYVVLLNNDTKVYPRALERLRSALWEPGVGIAGPVSTSGWQSWDRAGAALGTLAIEELRRFKTDEEREAYLVERFHERIWRVPSPGMVAFFCTMIRRDVVEQIGLLDARFGMGFGEDDQYCERAQRAGWDVCLALGAYVWHGHRTSWKRYMTANEIDDHQQRSIAELRAWRNEIEGE